MKLLPCVLIGALLWCGAACCEPAPSGPTSKPVAPATVAAPLSDDALGRVVLSEEAERRLMLVVPLSFALVVVMLYLAFMSLHDVAIVLANVSTLICGGVLGLLLVGMSFSVSAAVGFNKMVVTSLAVTGA